MVGVAVETADSEGASVNEGDTSGDAVADGAALVGGGVAELALGELPPPTQAAVPMEIKTRAARRFAHATSLRIGSEPALWLISSPSDFGWRSVELTDPRWPSALFRRSIGHGLSASSARLNPSGSGGRSELIDLP
jgi:hypothetical protein